MSAAELAVIQQGASTIVNIVTRMSHVWRATRTLPRRDAELLRIEVELTLRQCKASALGRLARVHLEEIKRTNEVLDGLAHAPEIYAMAVEELRILSRAFNESLEDYGRWIA